MKQENQVKAVVLSGNKELGTEINRLLRHDLPADSVFLNGHSHDKQGLEQRTIDLLVVQDNLYNHLGKGFIQDVTRFEDNGTSVIVLGVDSEYDLDIQNDFEDDDWKYVRINPTRLLSLPGIAENTITERLLRICANKVAEGMPPLDVDLALFPNPAFIFNIQGRILKYNDELCEVSGLTSDEFSSFTFQDYFAEKSLEKALKVIDILIEKGCATTRLFLGGKDSVFSAEFFFALLSGEKQEQLFLCSTSKVRTDIAEGDELKRISVSPGSIVVEQTPKTEKMSKKLQHKVEEYIRYEEALRKSEEHFRSLIENSMDIICILDTFGMILYINPAVSEVLGYSAEEVIGDNVFELLHPDDAVMFLNARNDIVEEEGTSRYVQVRFHHKDGSWKTLEAVGKSFLDANGAMKVIINSRDMTARKEAEEQLVKLNRELEMYAHTVSHDLRSPLTSIKAAGETLQSIWRKRDRVDDLGSNIERISDIIHLSVVQAEELINDLLTLAMAMQKPEMVSTIDVTDAVRKIIKERTPLLKERNAQVEYGKDLGSIKANKTHIYQVFGNLIENAIRHNDKEKPLVTITCEESKNGTHIYNVQDNGPGIRPEDAEKIFMPFSKGKNGHTGIGLAIVEKTVKLYGGDIRVKNNNGACFTFTLKDYQETAENEDADD
ncbi:MAG: PAS domain-containing sensor histidine kinase [Actinobacteria bacterium]|nr:PAS domain-containing sensor histidine kinase [Actinomycetota bacterium]